MTDLITRLSKLDAPDREVDAEIVLQNGWQVFPGDRWIGPEGKIVVPEYTRSVDAAIALAERVLPGWVFDNVGQDYEDSPSGYKSFGWTVEMVNGKRVQGQAPTFPLAICIALLRAKEASNGQ
ncbi:hypothetical protein QBD01_003734 [Ochrobactrum sp. 19YEA23]|uniref:hypothetical protein n=1 Tax=Ochrobactrum sp. 19YEA23 TaxID=3039854 RepID=UPI00247A296F|nr:hypothetical protein [Ochrobactrum sp. 19YEA23]